MMRRFRAFPTALLVVFAASLLATASAHAAPGDLDPTFSGDGLQTTDFGGGAYGSDVAVQANDGTINAGKIVVVGSAGGNFALARYNADGSLDRSFGTDGEQTTDFGGASDVARGVAVQADGRIVAVGGGGGAGFAVARYNIDGSLDSSFGTDGKLTTDFGGAGYGADVAVQADGKIVAVGGGGGGFAVARYKTDGSLDSSFDGDGKQTEFAGGWATAVALQGDGKIVAAGSAPGDDVDFALARYNADGSLDSSFDGDGKQLTAIPWNSQDTLSDVAIQPDGGLVVVGADSEPNICGCTDLVVAQYTPDGAADGFALTSVSGFDSGAAVALQPDGKIVVAGSALTDSQGDFLLARYDAIGAPDATFAADGIQITDFGGADGAGGVALQPDGKIVVAGSAPGGFALARYEGGSVSGTAPVNTTAPTISGSATEGQALTVSPGAWTGTAPISRDERWRRCDAAGANCVDITGASTTTYTLVAADVGHTIRVRETASNAYGQGAADSAATAVIKAKVSGTAPVNKTAPTISGTAIEGQALTVSPGAWTGTAPITRDERWRRCDAAGANCVDLAAASATTYTLVAADVGHTIRVRETASNAYGQGSADSAATAAIRANPGSITGSVRNSKSAAKIAKASVNCGGTYSATTASNGSYEIAKVASGTYACTASASGYQPSTQNVTVSPGQTITANFSLART
jgi:uncharacterized delta-60 repeat protein